MKRATNSWAMNMPILGQNRYLAVSALHLQETRNVTDPQAQEGQTKVKRKIRVET
jgi:hypothetical protein